MVQRPCKTAATPHMEHDATRPTSPWPPPADDVLSKLLYSIQALELHASISIGQHAMERRATIEHRAAPSLRHIRPQRCWIHVHFVFVLSLYPAVQASNQGEHKCSRPSWQRSVLRLCLDARTSHRAVGGPRASGAAVAAKKKEAEREALARVQRAEQGVAAYYGDANPSAHSSVGAAAGINRAHL